jgi:hypothetical protein
MSAKYYIREKTTRRRVSPEVFESADKAKEAVSRILTESTGPTKPELEVAQLLQEG